MTELLLLRVYPALLGLLIGSYLNVVIYRLPLGKSTVTPPSSCPRCGARIKARDNLPILGFLLLRGRCRQCGEAIAWRYSVVEATTGAVFVAVVATFGLGVEAVIGATFCCLLLVLALIDIDHMILPDRLTLPGIVVGLLIQPWWPRTSWRSALLGAVLGAGVIVAINAVWWLLRRVQGFGLGDAKMLAMIGAFLGPKGIAVTLLLATFSGSLFGLYLIVRRRIDLSGKLPFGTFLAIGAAAALFYGPQLLDCYLAFYS